MVVKMSTTAGEVPTIPASDDHRNGDWIATDIYVGEIFFNAADGLMFTRDINDNIVPVGSGNDRGYWVRRTLTNAEVLALNSTPIELIAAQGAGKIIAPLKILVSSPAPSTPYATNTNLRFTFGDDSTRVFTADGVLAEASAWSIQAEPVYTVSGTRFPANTGLDVYVPTGDPTAGTEDITILVYYSIFSA